jgi:hypothetical protein
VRRVDLEEALKEKPIPARALVAEGSSPSRLTR